MEIELDDLTLGFQEHIDFSQMLNDFNQHISTFQKMQTPDGASYVLIYQWIDPIAKEFNNREEAFYIDGVNVSNGEKALKIFDEVYNELEKEYEKDPDQLYHMTKLISKIANNYSSKLAK